MTWASVRAYLRQPTTISGIAALLAVMAGTVAHVITHDAPASAVIGGTVLGLMKIVMPDNTGAQSSVEKLVLDSVSAATTHQVAAAVPLIMGDVLAVFQTFTPKPTLPVLPAVVAPVPVPVAGVVA